MPLSRERMVGAVVMGLSLLAVVVSLYSSWRNSSYADCQSRVNEALIVAQNERAGATEHDLDAMDRLVSDVLNARTSADTRAALERYRDTRDQADADRAEHPLPAPPSQTCG